LSKRGKKRESLKSGRLLFLAMAAAFLFLAPWMEMALFSDPGIGRAWAGEKKEEPPPSAMDAGPMIKLSSLVVNLNEASCRHYIRTTIVLEVAQKEWVDEVQRRIPLLTDMIIVTLGDKKLTDLKGPQGKEELRKELLVKAGKTLASPRIRQIYFDEFLLQ
jgi:flagellar FliL protein